jgi:hypothetical protein
LDRSDLVNSLAIHEVSHDCLDDLSNGPLRISLVDRDCSFSLRDVCFWYVQKKMRIRQPVAGAGRLLAVLP